MKCIFSLKVSKGITPESLGASGEDGCHLKVNYFHKLNPQYFTFSVRLFGSVRGEFAQGAIAASHGTKCTLKSIPFFSPKRGRAQKGELAVPQMGGSCWQNLPWAMWLGCDSGWQQAVQGRCCCYQPFSKSFLLLPLQNLISSRSPCFLTGKFLASVSCKAALWGMFDTPGLGLLCHRAPGGLRGEVGKISFIQK